MMISVRQTDDETCKKDFVFELSSSPLALFVFVAHLKQNKIPTHKIHLSNDVLLFYQDISTGTFLPIFYLIFISSLAV